jgi:hypothetical protein
MVRQHRLLAVSPVAWACAVALTWTGDAVRVQAAETSIAWVTGSALEARLAEPVGADWSGWTLRDALTGLARAKHVAVYLDRRVDPDQKLQMSLKDVPLEDVFRQVAESRQLGFSRFGPVIYLGPPRFTDRLRTLAALRLEDVRKLPADVGQKFVRAQRLGWNALAEPRGLLVNLAKENGVEIAGLEQVPHDLWAAADLPPLSLVDRLTLLAGQFDLTFQIDPEGKLVALKPMPEKVSIVRSYPGGRQAEQLAERWATLAPEARIERSGNRIVVEGLVEDHERIAGAGRPVTRPTGRLPTKPAVSDGLDTKRFTVREASGPLNGVLDELARRLNLDLKIDRQALDEAGISLQQNVTFSAEDATLDQLLDKVLKPVRCTFRREGTVVEIGPAK